MDEALTITKVARLVGDAGSVYALRGRLTSGARLSWLVSLLELARDAGETGLLDGHNLLPTQGGGLRRRADIRRDEGISEELKDIAEAFGLEIRDELLDKGAELEGLAELLASGGVGVTPGDSRALADGIAALWDDPGRCRTLGEIGLEFVQRECSPERFLAGFQDLLREVVG